MKTSGRSSGRHWLWDGALVVAMLALGCAESGGKDGSQTHFTQMEDDDSAPTGTDGAPTTEVPSDDEADDSTDDDSTGEVADDDVADDSNDDDTPSSEDDVAEVPDDDVTGDDDVVDAPEDDSDDDTSSSDDDGAGGTSSVEPEPCTGAACGDDDVSAPYDPCADKLCGETCTLCDPADTNCVDDPVDLSCNASGACELGEAECSVAKPLCAVTEFESTEDGCVEESWVWDGVQCSAVTHCGCASGHCDNLYPDAASCEALHSLCVPAGCDPQDARSSGPQCGTTEGFAFDGIQCTQVFCVCAGEDCEDIEPTLEACEARFAHCQDRLPQCVPSILPTMELDPGYAPDYPPYDFSVDGYDSLFDEESQSFVVFGEWTRAEWLGWEEPADAEFCPGVPPSRFATNCPASRPLLLDVEGEVVRVNVTLHWDDVVLETATPTDVDVRISWHTATGTWVLEVKDVATELPVLMVVKSSGDGIGGEGSWEFAPFSFTGADPVCATAPDICDWTFLALGLEVTTDEGEVVLSPLGNTRISAGGADYAVFHGYIFEQSAVAPEPCAAAFSCHQTFAIVQFPPQPE